MSSGILVFIEHRSGIINKASFEAVAAGQDIGRSLGQQVVAVLAGRNLATVAGEVSPYDLSKVICAESDELAEYTSDGFTDAIEHLIRKVDPKYVIFPHTYMVRDFAPKVSARFGKGLISDCIRVKSGGGDVVFSRRVFLGKLDADVRPGEGAPIFATFQSGAYRQENAVRGTGAPVETIAAVVGKIRMRPEPPFQEVKQAVDLSKAEIIVAVGRGIKSKENIAVAEDLAKVLGAELAASRPICDAEWLPLDRQIGSSGQTVAPKLYIALGISGAIQHLVGMKNSSTIIAVNKDPEAPIFDIADYGIVGDLFEVVPALAEEIRKLKQ